MDNIGSIINIVGLIGLFLYQRYRMELLSESLEKQGELLEETKSVVTQQATAIASQATVVDAAIKYSQAFSPDRIEQIVRREVELEYKGEKKELEGKIQELSERKGGVDQQALKDVAHTAVSKTSEFFTPVVTRYSLYLLSIPAELRNKELAEIDAPETRELIETIVQKGEEIRAAMKYNKGTP